ncbi:M50 family metallopeptidase [Pyrinomonas methylaliphatogenes]|jgi:hypothetical protein|uniref:Peptidase M50B n=1 Tax=Pyrinomonas methylaliphatogenes TaxID=454194 RepID=A0A0B6WWG9_9BACT|nr:M50 family metallopeptidase [Pyrinomonas methylaliphatogenes]MBX5478948.1 M50 family metallopeptidase [Pyrinomonas methylaliphatogenes]CDM65623.1 Peptidase M50B [Pyrinomonas methylaliphatogenes]
MSFRLAKDARPQARTLLLVTALSIALWFVPYAEIVTYPFRLFVTFIHEGGHALAAVLTGNAVYGLRIMSSGSGVTLTTENGLLSGLIISSAGYLGAMLYGALLLLLIRRAVVARRVLILSAALILTLTVAYGLTSLFTVIAGVIISSGLLLAALFFSPQAATFLINFLAAQCVLNALLDLKTALFLSSPFAPRVPTDAMNMAEATGIPAFLWSIIWIALALMILFYALRSFAEKRTPTQPDLPFDDELD